MTPTIGRIVHYVLGAQDIEAINGRRFGGSVEAPPVHHGNRHNAGDVVPAMIVYVNQGDPPSINGQAFLDGNDSLWITSRPESTEPEPHKWHWPPRV